MTRMEPRESLPPVPKGHEDLSRRSHSATSERTHLEPFSHDDGPPRGSVHFYGNQLSPSSSKAKRRSSSCRDVFVSRALLSPAVPVGWQRPLGDPSPESGVGSYSMHASAPLYRSHSLAGTILAVLAASSAPRGEEGPSRRELLSSNTDLDV